MPDTSATPLEALSGLLADVVAHGAASIVSIHSRRSLSSGFVWRDGLVVTADEALAEDGEVAVTLPGGERRAASIAGRDPTTDVALLRVESDAPAFVPMDAGLPRAGALVLALGSNGGRPLASVGAVAHVGPEWRSVRGGRIDQRIDLDLSLAGQAEGGLVLDAAGRALGMAVLGPRRRALVIPSATVERVAATLQRHGRVPHGYLGLGLQAVRVAAGVTGCMVMSVDETGPGAVAGIRQGDVITAWDGQGLRSVDALLRTLGPDSVGRAVAVSLRRAGEPLSLVLTVGERPSA